MIIVIIMFAVPFECSLGFSFTSVQIVDCCDDFSIKSCLVWGYILMSRVISAVIVKERVKFAHIAHITLWGHLLYCVRFSNTTVRRSTRVLWCKK